MVYSPLSSQCAKVLVGKNVQVLIFLHDCAFLIENIPTSSLSVHFREKTVQFSIWLGLVCQVAGLQSAQSSVHSSHHGGFNWFVGTGSPGSPGTSYCSRVHQLRGAWPSSYAALHRPPLHCTQTTLLAAPREIKLPDIISGAITHTWLHNTKSGRSGKIGISSIFSFKITW